MYDHDHPPPHVHVFKDYVRLDRYDMANGRFMDGTIGQHRGRVLKALRALGLIE